MSFRARHLPTGLGGRSTLTTSDYLTNGYVQISLRLSLSYTTTIRFPLAPNTPEKYIYVLSDFGSIVEFLQLQLPPPCLTSLDSQLAAKTKVLHAETSVFAISR